MLILDDWGLLVLTPTERRDLLEILDAGADAFGLWEDYAAEMAA